MTSRKHISEHWMNNSDHFSPVNPDVRFNLIFPNHLEDAVLIFQEYAPHFLKIFPVMFWPPNTFLLFFSPPVASFGDPLPAVVDSYVR